MVFLLCMLIQRCSTQPYKRNIVIEHHVLFVYGPANPATTDATVASSCSPKDSRLYMVYTRVVAHDSGQTGLTDLIQLGRGKPSPGIFPIFVPEPGKCFNSLLL